MKTCTAPACERKPVAKSYCGSHYNQWKRKGAVSVILQSPQQRFWAKVNKSGDCWLWTAWIQPDGYGLFRLDGKMRRPHRVAWEWANGPIPEGMEIDHTCWTRACVNPAHMRLLSHAENGQNRAGAQANSASGIRGVTWRADSRKWRATARLNGTIHSLGSYATAEEAAEVVSAWRREHMPYSQMDRVPR